MMAAPEPLHYAIAHYILGDVATNLVEWQASLDKRRADAVAAFKADLATMTPPDGITFADYAEAQIDIVIDRWCQQRDAFTREIVAMIDPETVCASQHLGIAAELGQLIGLHLDNALRQLDIGLRAAADNAAVPR